MRYGAAALACVLALCAVDCSRPSAPGPATETLRIATSIPARPDASTGVTVLIDSMIFEAPVMIEWDGTALGKAVHAWEWSDDGLSLRLHLTPGIVFHDGTPLTNVLAAEILRSALAPPNIVVSSTVRSVTADGANDIVIRTGQPEGFLLSDISLANFSLPGKPLVGTGPFQLESKGEAVITLRAFQAFRLGAPGFQNVHITQYDTQRQAYAAMMRGAADVLHDVSGDSLDFVKEESALQTFGFTRAYYHALVFNLRLPLLARRGVRRALSMAVDREQIVKDGLRERGIIADGPVWPNHFAHIPNPPAVAHDPGQARRLLDAEGLQDGATVLPDRKPSRFQFTSIVAQEDQRLQRIALILQQQFFNIGVDMEVELVPLKAIRARVNKGQFEALLSEFAALRSLNYVYGFWHSPMDGAGYMGLPYAAADQPLDRLRAAVREQDVRAAVRDVQHALYDDPPAVFLDWMETTRALSRRIQVPDDGAHDVLRNIHEWKPAPRDRAPR